MAILLTLDAVLVPGGPVGIGARVSNVPGHAGEFIHEHGACSRGLFGGEAQARGIHTVPLQALFQVLAIGIFSDRGVEVDGDFDVPDGLPVGQVIGRILSGVRLRDADLIHPGALGG